MKKITTKLIAMLMALALLVSCAAAYGEETAAELAVEMAATQDEAQAEAWDAEPEMAVVAAEAEEAVMETEAELGDAQTEEIPEITEETEIPAEPELPVASEASEAPEAVEAVEAPVFAEEDAAAKLLEGEVAGVETVAVTNKAVLTLNVGETRQLAVEGKTIKSCKSSKKKVAGVTKTGLVTANKAGKSKLTVKLTGKKGKKLKVTVKVVDPYAPSSVSIANGKSVKLAKGEALQLTAAIAPETAQSGLTWKSSKKKIASVDANGVVTAKKKGKTTITVKTRNGKKAKIKVTVTKAAAQPGARIELAAYLGKNLGKSAKQLGLKWNSNNITGAYSNKQLTMGWELEKYWDEAVVENINLRKDSKGKYCLYGVYLGMSQADALATLAAQGFGPSGSYGNEHSYSRSGKKGELTVTFGSNGNVKKLYMDTNW